MKLRILQLLFLLFAGFTLQAQVTTSSMLGKITDVNGEALIGASITALHNPSGTQYGTVTDEDGTFTISNMRVGGPYTVELSYIGYATSKTENIYLKLGEPFRQNYQMAEESVTLEGVTISAKAGTLGKNIGSSTQITSENIDNMPTLNRGLNDFFRLTPQSTTTSGGGISFGGINNRYNSVFIDGAVNNDVFGLADNGTNGGQTGISPVSIDIIDQFQVVLSPYDVSLGGFAGGGINAVTKSGTNNLEGTAYFFLQNENMVGKTNKNLTDRTKKEAAKVNPFTNSLYGLSLGGALVKNKLFFFTNVELQNDNTPLPFDFETYVGGTTEADINSLVETVKTKYNYNPGNFLDQSDELKGVKVFGKLDYNLDNNHTITLRHSYTKGEQFDRFASGPNRINFSNNGIYFPSVTNSSALEIKSRIGQKMSNNLIVGFTRVRDNRDPLEQNFPYVTIDDGGRTNIITFGSEEFSTANKLEQDIFTLTDNFKLYRGNHTITLGTHNEYYDIVNAFIPQNFGSYRFRSISDFVNGVPAYEYRRSYSLVDELTGDKSNAVSALRAMQLGIYAQDDWKVSSKFSLTAGLRIDLPVILDDPKVDTFLNNTALPKIRKFYPIANDVEAGKSPDGQIMFSPRLGLNYELNKSITLRGGIGVFTSRIPFVWPTATFFNNGLTQGVVDRVSTTSIPVATEFVADPEKQYTNPTQKIPSGQINLFTPDFKYPQVLRGNLGIDFKLPYGIDATLEGIYTKTLNNILYTNINSDTTVSFRMTGSGDNRPVFGRKSIETTYSEVYLASNTDEGYTYTVSASVAKNFDFGLQANFSYTYGDAFALSEGTSSQNSSQWRGQIHVDGRNFASYGRSDFATGHRFLGAVNYTYNWTKDKANATTISLIYEGLQGSPYSYVIGGSNARNLNNETGSTSNNRSLIYIPEDRTDINLVDYKVGDVTITADEQWTKLNAYIESDPYLSENRGGYAEKNSNWMPYVSFLDLAVRQDVGLKLNNKVHKLQFSVDVFNLANLLNPSWGTRYSVIGNFNNFDFLTFEGYDATEKTKPRYTYRGGRENNTDAFNINDFSSRWRMRLGVRYIFK